MSLILSRTAQTVVSKLPTATFNNLSTAQKGSPNSFPTRLSHIKSDSLAVKLGGASIMNSLVCLVELFQETMM